MKIKTNPMEPPPYTLAASTKIRKFTALYIPDKHQISPEKDSFSKAHSECDFTINTLSEIKVYEMISCSMPKVIINIM